MGVFFRSDETEDEVVTPSPSPSPELRARSRSSVQPESGIKRLYVVPANTPINTHLLHVPISYILLFEPLHSYHILDFNILKSNICQSYKKAEITDT